MGNRHTDALHYTLLPPVPSVSGTTLRAVAWELCWMAGTDNGNACWPSYRDLADRARTTRTVVIRAMRWLWAIDLIVRAQSRANEERPGWQASNEYSLRGVVDIPEAEVGYRSGVKAFEGWIQRVPGRTLLFAHPAWVVSQEDHMVSQRYQGVPQEYRSGIFQELGWYPRDTGVVSLGDRGGISGGPKPLNRTLQQTLKRILQGRPDPPLEPSMAEGSDDGGTPDA